MILLLFYCSFARPNTSSSIRIRNRWKSAMRRIPEIKAPLTAKSADPIKIPSPKPPRRPSTAHVLASSAPRRSLPHSCSPARKITAGLSPASSTDSLSPPDQSRQRSSSFGHTTQYYRKKLTAKINLDLPIQKATSTSSMHSSNESLCDHSSETGSLSSFAKHSTNNACFRCMRKEKHKEVTQPNDLIFDHIHGEIRHRAKQAFGRTVHDEDRAPTVRKHSPKPKQTTTEEDTTPEPITADEFINKCIIESETTIIRAAQKPTASSLFSQLLGEFLPNHDDEPHLSELKPAEPPRERAYSMPSEWRKNRKTIPCGMRLHIEQTGL